MAGFFAVMNGHVYEGRYAAGEELQNGQFVQVVAGKVKKLTAADATLKMKVIEKTEFLGDPAVEVRVVESGNKDTFMVETLRQHNDGAAYDDRTAVIKAGELVRMRRPEMGDHMIINVTPEFAATLNAEDGVNPAIGGILAKS